MLKLIRYRFILVVFCCLLVGVGSGRSGATTQALPAQQAADWRFGVVEAYESPGDAAALGAAWTRVRFHWADVQVGGAGSWTPTVSDGQINGEVNSGRLVIGLLIGIPEWANEGGIPRGLWQPYDSPENNWAAYVREAVTRYSGRINHWVIWNEPDIWDPAAPGRTWEGSVEDFAQLQRVAYVTAKEANPNAVIHLAAMTYFWDYNYGREQYMGRLLDVIIADPNAAGNNYYFDVATAHLYFQPNTVYDVTQAFYGIMGVRGIWKPIWLVETNAPPLDDPVWPVPNWTLSVTQNEQAAFMPQAVAAALAAGAHRIAIYKLKDTPDDVAANPEPFGLVRMDGSRRPAFNTYRVATQYMAGMQGASRERWNEVGQIRIDQEEQSTTVIFARLPAPQVAQVPATADSAVLVDMWGARRTITAVDGFFEVDLPGALCSQPIGDYCMIGGTTYYVVQSATGGAPPGAPSGSSGSGSSDTTTTPAATASFTLTVTMESTETPIVTLTATRIPRLTATSTPEPTATSESPTITAAPTNTPAVTALAELPPTAEPLETPPAAAPQPDTGTLSYWFIGLGILVSVGLVIFMVYSRMNSEL